MNYILEKITDKKLMGEVLQFLENYLAELGSNQETLLRSREYLLNRHIKLSVEKNDVPDELENLLEHLIEIDDHTERRLLVEMRKVKADRQNRKIEKCSPRAILFAEMQINSKEKEVDEVLKLIFSCKNAQL
ncbi:hypothetical protein [Ferruginibacter sp. HRS2-29]|uniref:hypothetical protein n=1 Tax=Ferruginibacter sp. HRS2-29 TaxID=2487334 RepID=UPI0020CF67F8|nr:hypothetical protein [Ferruginibacter sp. HRS2-29]MCP9749479.1 hypothetical protein [Ferruginibacter sp. HRS2-29]